MGRPRALTDRDMRRAVRAIDSGGAIDGADVRKQLFPEVGASTLRRNLCEVGLEGRVRREKPLLTDEYVAKRKTWADKHKEWTLSKWKKVWFTDESKFNIIGSDGKRYCRRRVGEALRPDKVKKKVKHGGGNIKVWGCISWEGTGRLALVDGNLDAVQYCQILDSAFMGSLRDRGKSIRSIIFQQDNDPKHTSRRAREYFEDQSFDKMAWPPGSADMSIIEHVWDKVDDQIRARNPLPRNKNDLWVALQEEWEKVDIEYIQNLYRSMTTRVAALDEVKGSYTKY